MTGQRETICVKNLSFAYRDNQVFSDISFKLYEGDILTILGPNGSGKSTLLNCIANLLIPVQGSVSLCGVDVKKMSGNEIAKCLGYVPQISTSNFSYSVQDYVVMGRAPHIGLLRMPRKRDIEMADEVLEQMNISHLADKAYTQISGGERQQVQIARVLLQQSKIILLDEPTNYLDYGNQHRVLELLHNLANEGYTVILTTHVPDHPLILGGKVGLLMGKGQLEIGPVEDVIDQQTLCRIYKADLRLMYLEELERRACFYKGFNK